MFKSSFAHQLSVFDLANTRFACHNAKSSAADPVVICLVVNQDPWFRVLIVAYAFGGLPGSLARVPVWVGAGNELSAVFLPLSWFSLVSWRCLFLVACLLPSPSLPSFCWLLVVGFSLLLRPSFSSSLTKNTHQHCPCSALLVPRFSPSGPADLSFCFFFRLPDAVFTRLVPPLGDGLNSFLVFPPKPLPHQLRSPALQDKVILAKPGKLRVHQSNPAHDEIIYETPLLSHASNLTLDPPQRSG